MKLNIYTYWSIGLDHVFFLLIPVNFLFLSDLDVPLRLWQ